MKLVEDDRSVKCKEMQRIIREGHEEGANRQEGRAGLTHPV